VTRPFPLRQSRHVHLLPGRPANEVDERILDPVGDARIIAEAWCGEWRVRQASNTEVRARENPRACRAHHEELRRSHRCTRRTPLDDGWRNGAARPVGRLHAIGNPSVGNTIARYGAELDDDALRLVAEHATVLARRVIERLPCIGQ
jgi:hypothetical protein